MYEERFGSEKMAFDPKEKPACFTSFASKTGRFS